MNIVDHQLAVEEALRRGGVLLTAEATARAAADTAEATARAAADTAEATARADADTAHNVNRTAHKKHRHLADGIAAETMERTQASGATAMTAGQYRVARIHLVPGSYTRILVCTTGVTTSGASNTFFALHRMSDGVRLAVTSDVSSSFNGVTANVLVPITMNCTVTVEDDYWIGCVQGAASVTGTQLAGTGNTGHARLYGATSNSQVPLMGTHNVASLTASPDPFVNATGGEQGSTRWFWMRYD